MCFVQFLEELKIPIFFRDLLRSVNLASNTCCSQFFQNQTKLMILSIFFTQDIEFRLFSGRIEEATIYFRDCLIFSLRDQNIFARTKRENPYYPYMFRQAWRGMECMDQSCNHEKLIHQRPILSSDCSWFFFFFSF